MENAPDTPTQAHTHTNEIQTQAYSVTVSHYYLNDTLTICT